MSMNSDLYGGGSASGKGKSATGMDKSAFNSRIDNSKKEQAIMMGNYKKYLQFEADLAEKYEIDKQKAAIEGMKENSKERKAAEAQLQKSLQAIQQQAFDATQAYCNNKYKHASSWKKAEMDAQRVSDLKEEKEAAEERYEYEMALAEGNSELQKQLTEEYRAEIESLNSEMDAASKRHEQLTQSKGARQLNQLQDSIKDVFKSGVTDSEGNELSTEDKLKKVALQAAQMRPQDLKEGADANYKKASEEYEASLEKLNQTLNDPEATEEEKQAAKEAAEAARAEKDAAALTKEAANALNSVAEGFNKAFDEVVSMMSEYKGSIDSRLYGSDKSYNKVMDMISTNLSLSPYVQTKQVIETMRSAAEQGIVYNLEQRAFLATISDKIASTFDAFDSNLTRLIKLQQADTTAARMGMEAALTKFLNNAYQDNSYMNKGGVADSVAAALIDANATMTRDMSAAFEFTVQKWLGSLYSLGMSDGAITQIAEGINYIATGNVQALSNNTSLQTMFAMAASNAGLSYSDLLIEGLDASNTNKLLASMVEYLKDIAENSDNQVVRSAYGDIFSMSMSDMKAISNLTTSDISNISSTMMSYADMGAELQSQFDNIGNRMTMTSMLSNLYENAVFGVAEDMASNPVTFAMTKMLQYMEDADLDIALPFINAFGTGLDLNTSVQDLLNLGVGLTGAMSLVGNILGGLGSGGGLNLNSWNSTEYTKRGGSMSFSTSSAAGSSSNVTYMSNTNSTDLKNSATNSATDDAEETGKITNKNNKNEYTIEDVYKSIIEGTENNSWARVEEKSLSLVLNSTSDYLHALDTRLVIEASNLRVADFATTTVLNNNDAFLNVHDSFIDVKDRSLSVIDPRAAYVGGVALTTDSFLIAQNKALFGETSLVSTSGKEPALRVTDTDTFGSITSLIGLLTGASKPTGSSSDPFYITAAPTTKNSADNSLSVKISNLNEFIDSLKEALKSVTTVKFDNDALAAALREALYGKKDEEQALTKLYELFNDMKTTDGLQVKLESIGSSAEMTYNNIFY